MTAIASSASLPVAAPVAILTHAWTRLPELSGVPGDASSSSARLSSEPSDLMLGARVGGAELPLRCGAGDERALFSCAHERRRW